MVFKLMNVIEYIRNANYTVNHLYNDIRYNSKNRYNVRSAQKSADRVFFFIDSPMLFFRKTYVLDSC